MLFSVLSSSVALLVGFLVLWRVAGGRRSLSPGDVGMMLAAAEIVQLMQTFTKVDVRLSFPSAVVPVLCLAGIALMVVGTYIASVSKVVTALGVLAALLDTLLSDGPGPAMVIVLTIGIMWLLARLIRLVLPW